MFRKLPVSHREILIQYEIAKPSFLFNKSAKTTSPQLRKLAYTQSVNRRSRTGKSRKAEMPLDAM